MTTRLFASISRRRLLVVVLLLLSTITMVILRRPSARPEAQILSMPEKPPSYPSNPLDRWIPMKWGWLWKIRYAVFGYNPSIHISPTFTDLSATPQDVLHSLLPVGPPLAQTNETQVWILPPDEYHALQMRLRSTPSAAELGGCRMTTGPWVQANFFSGLQLSIDGTQRPVGVNVNIYTRLNGKAVDLTALCTVSKADTNPLPGDLRPGDSSIVAIQTNLSLAARFVVPESNGVFVLDSSRFATEHRRAAISITPRIEPYQKK